MDLLHAFREFIQKEKLFIPNDRLLVAVSGGVDSVVLCELCRLAGLRFVLAHCNFGLRGAESGRDEEFVRRLADSHGREVLVKTFDTKAFAALHKVSVQVAARELRYAWFSELVLSGKADYVATAHHLNDNIETLLMNFFKGTGIGGLRAMLPRQGIVVRPLLFAERADIEHFAREKGLSWVEDSSNLEDKYTRNFFRHRLIPLVQRAYPGAVSNLAGNIARFGEIELVYRRAIEQQKKKLLEHRGREVYIPVLKLKQSAPLNTLVYEITAAYGFSTHQVEAVIGLLSSASGKYVLSGTHRILKDRNWLIISPLEMTEAAILPVEATDAQVVYEQGVLRLEKMASSRTGQLDQGPLVALVDAKAVRYPLLLRKWKPGDYFYPLGMRKKKKLARFFIDQKLSVADKEKVWVLESEKRILWVIGLRIDDRCRVGPGSTEVLQIVWAPARNGDS
ncbi:MAG TPA: tRNA lysidine(34) synthetase TilS [Puia sp.]|jgi:tRNA(Ile)-lysidine synthase|nr:tRNA lysidine(34) synthetase TilS [Puia sp.]